MSNDYNLYTSYLQKIADLRYSASLLTWDQETQMPVNGADFRSQQITTLTSIGHQLFTDDKFGELLQKLGQNKTLSDKQARNVAVTIRDYNRLKKLPESYVEKKTRVVARAFTSWARAKEENNFSIFAPQLSKIITLLKEECEYLGYSEHPYDALLDMHEFGMSVNTLEPIFDTVKTKLVPLINKISEKKEVDDTFFYKNYDLEKQWDYSRQMLKVLGYEYKSGKQDLSVHPFTVSLGPQDVRITTRIDENNLREILWSCIHEAGHGMYEQGLGDENYGLPSGHAVSLSIHESQSRLWENNIGREIPFWKYFYPILNQLFPKNLLGITVEDFYKALNKVIPSPIRTNADELTYHLHILIRYEVEKELIGGNININDLPELWNKKYKDYLGLDIVSDQFGVLQDVHWAHGSFGYFPTYTLGSFYAAQFHSTFMNQNPNAIKGIASGNFSQLLYWLRSNIHQHGSIYSPDELCKRVTGESLNPTHFINYALKKYSRIYDLKLEKLEEFTFVNEHF